MTKVAKAILAQLTPTELSQIWRAVETIQRFQQHDLDRIRAAVRWVEDQQKPKTLRSRLRRLFWGDL